MEYNVVIQFFANTTIKGTPKSVREKVKKLLKTSSSFMLNGVRFDVEGGEITGVFDDDWNELD